MSNEKFYANGNLYSVVTFAVIVRWSVSLHSYSGQNTGPMFGDYEAQRHWMEITVNLPPEEWYFNTSNNDLLYWGLDYPPLTAYHSYVNGQIAKRINPDYVQLGRSRGYESTDHKLFMRSTVIVTDLLVYFASIILFFNSVYKAGVQVNTGEMAEPNKAKTKTLRLTGGQSVSHLAQVAIALLYPGLILIDHGHFQYNSISLGFTVFAITSLVYSRFAASAFYFCLALNYKQMSLYHSLPFFVYMLSKSFQLKKISYFTVFQRLMCISLTVLVTFAVIWFPFLTRSDMTVQVVRRLFPFSRGIFEDKVSNFWCAANVLYKLNQIENQMKLAKLCIACVLGGSLISLISLFRNPTVLKLILSSINVSLSFFLFSYQVHEKSILLVALPVLLYFPFDPFPCFWFLLVSTFSMFPLFVKDNLLLPFTSLSVLFTVFVYANVNFPACDDKKLSKNSKGPNTRKYLMSLTGVLFKLSLFGYMVLMTFSLGLQPPVRYPDLWPLLISVYSFMHFFLFGVYFNYHQIVMPVEKI